MEKVNLNLKQIGKRKRRDKIQIEIYFLNI